MDFHKVKCHEQTLKNLMFFNKSLVGFNLYLYSAVSLRKQKFGRRHEDFHHIILKERQMSAAIKTNM